MNDTSRLDAFTYTRCSVAYCERDATVWLDGYRHGYCKKHKLAANDDAQILKTEIHTQVTWTEKEQLVVACR